MKIDTHVSKIANHILSLNKTAENLKWYSDEKVRILIGNIIPASDRQTTLSRRKSFRDKLETLLKPYGWIQIAYNVYEKKSVLIDETTTYNEYLNRNFSEFRQTVNEIPPIERLTSIDGQKEFIDLDEKRLELLQVLNKIEKKEREKQIGQNEQWIYGEKPELLSRPPETDNEITGGERKLIIGIAFIFFTSISGICIAEVSKTHESLLTFFAFLFFIILTLLLVYWGDKKGILKRPTEEEKEAKRQRWMRPYTIKSAHIIRMERGLRTGLGNRRPYPGGRRIKR